MQQIINFVLRNKNFLLFLLLFIVSIALTLQTHSYHKSKFISSANFLSGGVYESATGVSDYFDLKEQNQLLVEENNRLRSQMFNSSDSSNTSRFVLDTSTYKGTYEFMTAKVINNNYSSTKNYLTLNKGRRDSVAEDYGVITSKGIVGIIDNTSKGYARVLSILNTRSRINAQLKSTDHIGTLEWDGNDFTTVQLTDISTFAPVKEGDTIITGGQSSIFPKGIQIGIIQDFTTDISGDTYTINVKLFNDMSNISHVYIIKNRDAEEIRTLESGEDEQ